MEQWIREQMQGRQHMVVEDVAPEIAEKLAQTATEMGLWAHINKIAGQRELDVAIQLHHQRFHQA